MRQLSGLDASFLYLETPEMPMHIGALYVLEMPAGYKGRFVRDLRKHLQSRLVLAPALRKRLWMMPFNLANPAWVDAEVDIEQHVIEIKLPKGSGLAALEAQVGQLHPKLLDRSRPLWRFYVLEGLANGPSGHKRVGLYSQLHHAAADGQAAVAIANAILDLQPKPRDITQETKVSTRTKTFKLGMVEMLRGALASEVEQISRIVKALPDTVDVVKTMASQSIAQRSAPGGKKGAVSNLAIAPRLAINTSITAGRAFAGIDLPMAEIKALGRAHDATINDLVLMICSTALRRYLGKRKVLPRKSLIAAVPISLREKGDTRADNQASMSLISMGTNVSDTAARLEHIKKATRSMKDTMGGLKRVLPTDFPSIGVPWIMEAATALYGKTRLADRIPQLANLVISNVPGPPVPLYLAGGRILGLYPTSIIVHGMGLNITLQSYDQSLGFGLMADSASMPDVRELADAIAIAFDDLRALSAAADEVPSASAVLVDSVGRAGRKLTGAATAAAGELTSAVAKRMGKAAQDLVAGAVAGAARSVVAGATARGRAGNTRKRTA